MTRVALLVTLLVCVTPITLAQAQKKAPVANSALCTRNLALDNAKQQILFARTFDGVVQRISVLLRAADLLWPYDAEKASAAFMEAFDLAVQNFKEHGDQVKRTSQSRFAAVIEVPDQRYKVIGAIAKRDPAKARKLSEELMDEAAREAADKPVANDQDKIRTAEKLLSVATELVKTDQTAAMNFARQSFRYPATLYLPIFLYQLAKVNQPAANRLYEEALAAYSSASMDRMLYLSAYPFANTRDAGDMPGYTTYLIPETFVANQGLQRLFVQRLLARAQAATEVVMEPAPPNRLSDHGQMWLAFTRLEKQIQANLPDLAEQAAVAKDQLYSSLPQPSQTRLTNTITRETQPKKTFDELVEAAEKMPDVNTRDQNLTMAVIGSSKGESIERVVSVVDKISDADVRSGLLNWFYFFRTQDLIKEKNLEDARKTAAKVVELDQRAYLFSRIAEESLKRSEDQTQAREMLNEIGEAAGKAPKTVVSARALLALAYLYAKIDVNRGVEEMGNAVKVINAIESPDFSQQFVMMKLEGKTFGSFASYATPGFNPENAFREIGKLDFDGSLVQAATFADKSLRALTTLAVIEPCFEAAPPKSTTKKPKS
ncbi:MAG TPA: hypothetical protein VFZ22_11470 [Pyrinomonadaceae bacterium]|nr:hypothetical protein [Pyrinomonadaceae bacterium]